MKNKIIVIFLLSLLVPNLAFAILYPSLGGTGPGTQYNPINVQISQDPYEQKRQENLSLESQLKAQYGYNIYISCKASVCGSYDYGDSYSVGSCLAQLESWLGMGYCQAQREQTIKNMQCASGYVKSGSSCITRDTSCKAKYTNSIWTGEISDQGGSVCGCATGFQLNDQKTSCVIAPVAPVVPVKSNDQICQSSFGLNVKWDGTKNNAGGLNCNCQTGYVWNGQRTSCVIAPITPAAPVVPVKSKDQVCVDTYGSNSKSILNEKGNPTCGCKDGYAWENAQQKRCVTNDQACSATYPNTIFLKNDDVTGGPICECQSGYVWNQGGTQCVFAPKAEVRAVTPTNKTESEIKSVQNEIKESVPDNSKDELSIPVNPDKEVVTNTEVVKPKSFWARLIGWFGF